MILCSLPGQAVLGADAPAAGAATTSQLLARYIADPAGSRRAVGAIARHGLDGLPVGMLLVVADARLRSGENAAAIDAFLEVLERQAGRPWSSVAELGIGWASLAGGDLATARAFLEGGLATESAPGAAASVQQTAPGLRELAMLGVGLLDAYDGTGAAAAARLNEVAVAQMTDWSLRPVARLGAGYALYWAGAYQPAAIAFDLAAFEYPQAETADDAAFAAAWSRWHAGERDRALDDLHALARAGRMQGRASDDLVDLPPWEVLIGGLQGDRRSIVTPAQRLAAALDLDGSKLARLAIRRLERSDESEDPSAASALLTASLAPAVAAHDDPRLGGREITPGAVAHAGYGGGASAAEETPGGTLRNGSDTPAAATHSDRPEPATATASRAGPAIRWLALGLLLVGLVGLGGRAVRRIHGR